MVLINFTGHRSIYTQVLLELPFRGPGQALACQGDEQERRLLLEAGAELAAAGGNGQCLNYFGLKWIVHKDFYDSLACLSQLGVPVFVSPSPEELEANSHLISSQFSRADGCPYRRLIMAMDRTYLVAANRLAKTHKGSILSGWPHRPPGFEQPDESLTLIRQDSEDQHFDLKRPKATEMESYIMWDATRRHSCALETAAYPCLAAASKDWRLERAMAKPKNKRGKWEALLRCGQVLANSPAVRFLICDSHGSHDWIRTILLGQSCPLPPELLELVPFFAELVTEDLPAVGAPFPFRAVKFQGQYVGYIPGVCHIQKNFAEQGRSSLRTMFYGNKFLDCSATLTTGMFHPAYVGHDSMSDYQAAIWSPGSV